MRAFFMLLVLANLAFFAWDRYLRTPVSAEDRIRQVQLTPEKIRPLKANTLAPAPRESVAPEKSSTAPASIAVCMEWGAFYGAEIARADAAMAALALPAAQVKRTVVDASGYWVYLPPLKSRAEAEQAGAALKDAGIADYLVVQEQTAWNNAVSLGIFRTDEAARTFLAEAKKKGVSDARVGKRESLLKQVVFHLREPSDATVAKLKAMRTALPVSELRAVPCAPQ